MLEKRVNTPPTSSAGRLFDAVAALVGVRDRVSYEGEAAMELEWLAERAPHDGAYAFDLIETGSHDDGAPVLKVDTRPVITSVVEDTCRGVDSAQVARRFHMGVVDLIGIVCDRLRSRGGPRVVVLSGGVFMNTLLVTESRRRLESLGLQVYTHRHVPTNDGGLSLGQLAIAAARIAASP